MWKFYKVFAAIIVILCSLLLAVSTGNSKKNDSKKNVKLVLTTISGVNADRFKHEAEAFHFAYPNVEIEINEFDEDLYKQQAPRLFDSSEKPDIAFYWNDRGYQSIVNSGDLVPLDDLYVKEQWNKILPRSTIKQYTSPDGHKYAVNTDVVCTPIIYYNEEAFQKAGVKPPKTFDQLFAIAPLLKRAGYIPLVTGTGEPYIVGHIFDAILERSVTGDQYDKLLDHKNRNIQYSNSNVQNAWRILRKIAIQLLPEGNPMLNDNQARALFVQGKAAMYSNGSWAAGEALLGKELGNNFNLGYLYYPSVKAGVSPKVGLYSGNALMVLKGTGKEEWAKKFLSFVMSYERQKELSEEQSFFPSRTDIKPKDMQAFGKVFGSMYKEMNQIGTVPLWDQGLSNEMASKILDWNQKVLFGRMTPEEIGRKIEKLFGESL